MSLAESDVPYLERTWPVRIILGSFFLITIPLTVMALTPRSSAASMAQLFTYAFAIQAVGLGTTHFIITGALYLQRENLEYFASQRALKLIYFGGPIAIFTLFGLIGATDFQKAFPAIAAGFFFSIRIFDFTHVTRQSFGMLQLFKGSHRDAIPGWTRKAENFLFVGLAVLQMGTFYYGGRFDWNTPALAVGASLAAAVFLVLVGVYVRAIAASRSRKGLVIALTYLTFQVLSASLTVYMTMLYVISLTMHYVEYHVMMRQRCFETERDPSSRVDRLMSWFRSNRWVFYGGIIAMACAVRYGTPELLYRIPSSIETFPLLFFLHLVAGLSLAHFFVEAFLWKFSKPFYRETLGPIYR